jgi:dihydrofolate reductase
VIVSIIAAMDLEGLIGTGLHMPWHLPTDLRRFRNLTWGKPIIMGRKTFEGLGKPLIGRPNIILSRQKDFDAKGCHVCHSLRDAIELGYGLCDEENEIMIIGGGEVFREAISIAQRFYKTTVLKTFSGDTFFPLDKFSTGDWEKVAMEHFEVDEITNISHNFEIFQKRNSVKILAVTDFGAASC